jgi:catechol 2,3-dioxygenase-like lactoylglutathione lyase family enzyme
MMQESTSVFTVRDLAESLAYYRDKLGFAITFEYGHPVFYAGLCRDKVTLHLVSASQAPRQPGNGAVAIMVRDVDALHAELVESGARVIKAPKDYDYGLRDFDVADLDGNMLFFGMESKKAK